MKLSANTRFCFDVMTGLLIRGKRNLCLCLPRFQIIPQTSDQNTSPALMSTFGRIPFQGKLEAFHRCFTGFGALRKQKPIKFRPKLARTRGPKKPPHTARRSVNGTALAVGWFPVGRGLVRGGQRTRTVSCLGALGDKRTIISARPVTRKGGPKHPSPLAFPEFWCWILSAISRHGVRKQKRPEIFAVCSSALEFPAGETRNPAELLQTTSEPVTVQSQPRSSLAFPSWFSV